MKTIIEPFRVKVVEPIKITTREERERFLVEAHYNLFLLNAENVIIDLLTDSGTAAMSAEQWSAIMRGDESYAGSSSFYRFESTVKDIYGFKHVIPAHQGRAAERILFSVMARRGDVIPNNTHFDTTRANIEYQEPKQSICRFPSSIGPLSTIRLKGTWITDGQAPYPANGTRTHSACYVDCYQQFRRGQPVSMENIREVKSICSEHESRFT
jgi:tryptophanase